VRVQQLESTDAFVLFDLEGAAKATGVARLAPKVLRDSAELLARSVTYSFAAFGLKLTGASAGINAKPDQRDEALSGFLDAVKPLVADGLSLHAGTGLSDSDLAPLGIHPPDPVLTVHGALAAAGAAAGTLVGKTVAVVGSGPVADNAKLAAGDRGATVDDTSGFDATADVLLVAGKTGVVDHDAADSIKAKVVVPLSPLPVTAKAFAALRRAEILYVPDFIALAAPLLDQFDPSEDSTPAERVRAAMQEVVADGPDAWLAAVAKAEAFLSTWQDALPFGRPLA